MSSRLYKLALWYIKKCNAKWENRRKEKVESLTRLTYWNFGKYMLLYGADAEWQIFGRYDVLDNAIQRLGEYEDIGTVEEFKALKENQCKCEDCAGCTVWKCDCANTRQQAIDEFVEKICEKYTEEERKGNYKKYCGEIKQNIADIAEQLKG